MERDPVTLLEGAGSTSLRDEDMVARIETSYYELLHTVRLVESIILFLISWSGLSPATLYNIIFECTIRYNTYTMDNCIHERNDTNYRGNNFFVHEYYTLLLVFLLYRQHT